MDSELSSKFERAVAKAFPQAQIAGCSQLTPDASLRTYYRLELHNAPAGSAVAMVFNSLACPEYEGAEKIPSDQSYVELTGLFRTHRLPVPELYADCREESLLLIEDLGPVMLADLMLDQSFIAAGGLARKAEVKKYIMQAVDCIALLQKIPDDGASCCFKRRFSGAVYFREMQEFTDFAASGSAGWTAGNKARIGKFFEHLSAELEALPQVLVHRDFHGWNLVIDSARRLRLIDFQDALLATRSYDVAALLNDRDMDHCLGRDLYRAALEQFRSALGAGPEFYVEYGKVLLQRDLKVAGRFAKLVQLRNLKRYQSWIPGTQQRIGRTLSRLVKDGAGAEYAEALRLLTENFEEIATGSTNEQWY